MGFRLAKIGSNRQDSSKPIQARLERLSRTGRCPLGVAVDIKRPSARPSPYIGQIIPLLLLNHHRRS